VNAEGGHLRVQLPVDGCQQAPLMRSKLLHVANACCQ
jgi:hypothetical protein